MARNVIKCDFWVSRRVDGGDFLREKKAYLSIMARMEITSDFRPYKIADAGHFVKNFKNN